MTNEMKYIKTIDNDLLFADVIDIIREGGSICLRIKGNSMHSFLKHERDIVHLAPIGDDRLRRGMVVLFQNKNRYILHRVCRINGDTVVLKGDNNYRTTELTAKISVYAYAYAVERKGKIVNYGSAAWRRHTFISMGRSMIKTMLKDIKRIVKKQA